MQKRNKTNNNKRRRPKARLISPTEISDIQNLPKGTRSMRYTGTGITSLTYSDRELTNFMGHVTTSSTSFYPICSEVRLLSVTVYLCPKSAGFQECTVFWTHPSAPLTRHTMIAYIGQAAKLHLQVPINSEMLWWFQTTGNVTNSLFEIDSSAGADLIIDTNFIWTPFNGTQSAITLGGASAITGYAARKLPASPSNVSALELSNVF